CVLCVSVAKLFFQRTSRSPGYVSRRFEPIGNRRKGFAIGKGPSGPTERARRSPPAGVGGSTHHPIISCYGCNLPREEVRILPLRPNAQLCHPLGQTNACLPIPVNIGHSMYARITPDIKEPLLKELKQHRFKWLVIYYPAAVILCA